MNAVSFHPFAQRNAFRRRGRVSNPVGSAAATYGETQPRLGSSCCYGVRRGAGLGVDRGVAVAVGVTVDAAVDVSVAVGVGAGVGEPDSAQYVPPVFKLLAG